jgi:CheY-like chemotaxis protein
MENAKKTVFVVDDDKMFATMLADHLEALDIYTVKTFATGEDCLNSLDERPDAIILDYYLDSAVPDALNGLEILKRIKSVDPDLKVVMLSSQEHYGVALQTIVKGALYYIIKDIQSFKEIERLLEEIA